MAIVKDGLVRHWTLNGNLQDSVKGSYDLVASNTTGYSYEDGGITLNGTINLKTADALLGTDNSVPFTIGVEYKNIGILGSLSGLLTVGSGQSHIGQYCMGFYSSNGRWLVSNGTGDAYVQYIDEIISTQDKWSSLYYVFNGMNSIIYVDGVELKTLSSISKKNSVLTLGGFNNTTTQNSGTFSNARGTFRNLVVYNRALTKEEIGNASSGGTGTVSNFTIHKTLKEKLPQKLDDTSKDQLHFTEDGGIYLSKQDGTFRKVGIDDENQAKIDSIKDKGVVVEHLELKELSNPLTTQPLEYGYFKLSQNVSNYTALSNFPFNTIVNGNMEIQNGVVKLKKGKMYYITCGMTLTYSAAANLAVAVGVYNNDTGERLIASNQVSPTYTTAMSGSDLKGILTPTEDINICIRCNQPVTTIGSAGTNFIVQEIRNNPVAQYGGFETQVLFDGDITTTGSYDLSDDINNYNFLYIYNFDDSGVDIIPKMTNNTTPSPYVITTSSIFSTAFNGYLAFDKTYSNASTGDVWATAEGSRNGWIKIDCGSQKSSDFCRITSRQKNSNQHTGLPDSVIISGSNDDVRYDEIVNQKNITWNIAETKEFSFGSKKQYRYYKFEFTTTNYVVVSINEISLFEKTNKITETMFIPSESGVYENDNISMFIEGNKLNVNNITNKISKIIGIKGQLPSLLNGGVF